MTIESPALIAENLTRCPAAKEQQAAERDFSMPFAEDRLNFDAADLVYCSR